METAFYNIMKPVIDPRYMSIFRFKKGCKKIQFPCHNIVALYWINNDDKETSIICNGQHRNEPRVSNYYQFEQPYKCALLSANYLLSYNRINENEPNRLIDSVKNNEILKLLVGEYDYSCVLRSVMQYNEHLFSDEMTNDEFNLTTNQIMTDYLENAKYINSINAYYFRHQDYKMETENISFIGGLDIKNYSDDMDIIVIVHHDRYYYKANHIFI